MSVVLLLQEHHDETYATAHRVRHIDRLRTRLHAFTLDQALASGAAPESSALLALRAQTLLHSPVRDQLTKQIQRLLTDAHTTKHRLARAPISSATVRAAAPELTRLAERLHDEDPVAARGLATVRILLCDGQSPLYGRDATTLRAAIDAALQTLEIDG